VSGVPWLIITGYRLDDWIYWHLIHTTRDYRQYSAIAILHTLQFTVTHALGFSVFTSHILATDLSLSLQLTYDVYLAQSNSFLAISCSCQFRRLDRTLFRLLFCTPKACVLPVSESELLYDWVPYIDAAWSHGKRVSRVRMRGADHRLATEVFVLAGMRLPSRCLAIWNYFTYKITAKTTDLEIKLSIFNEMCITIGRSLNNVTRKDRKIKC
jgi:hypothetical protein